MFWLSGWGCEMDRRRWRRVH